MAKAKTLSTDEKLDLLIAVLKANGMSLPEALDPQPASTTEAATAALAAIGGEHYWLLPGNGVRLAFDLGSLPAGLSAAQMRRCVLRVVASEVRYVREHEAVAAVVELAVSTSSTNEEGQTS